MWRIICCFRILAIFCGLMACTAASYSAEAAKVFPVKGFFFDAKEDSKLDKIFQHQVKEVIGVPKLADDVFDKLNTAFGDRVGVLNASTVGNTFAVSFHVTRAVGYQVDKKNGTVDLITPITAGIYFTNIATGEILTTISRSSIGQSVVSANSDKNLDFGNLYRNTLYSLISDLTEEAAKNFNPIEIEAKFIKEIDGLLVLDAGFKNGIQIGDQLEDASDNLIRIVYSGSQYSVGVRVLADALAPGAVFKKFQSHSATGKERPRVAVLIDNPPANFARDYIARLFAELLGDSSPLTVVQVNTNFSQLLNAVKQQDGATLSSFKFSERTPPNFVIRLRVLEPIAYETTTNLAFEKFRNYETFVFADVVDETGRVVYSFSGKDTIKDKVTNEVGVSFEQRKETSIKNAIADISNKMQLIGEPVNEYSVIGGVNDGGDYFVNSKELIFSNGQAGFIVRKEKLNFGGEIKEINIPIYDAKVEGGLAGGKYRVKLDLHMGNRVEKVAIGNLLHTQRFGSLPKSARTLSMCGPVESLGAVVTPGLLEMTSSVIGKNMPGMIYVPEISKSADSIISRATGFSSSMHWSIPAVEYCIQPVDRVNTSDEICVNQCERQITARYTLRLKSGDAVISRVTFEGRFKSSGYFQNINPNYLKLMIDSDLIDEAFVLIDKAAEKITLPPVQ